jgi:hypothetical protein
MVEHSLRASHAVSSTLPAHLFSSTTFESISGPTPSPRGGEKTLSPPHSDLFHGFYPSTHPVDKEVHRMPAVGADREPSCPSAQRRPGPFRTAVGSSGDIISNRCLTGLPVRGMVWAWDGSHEWYYLGCRIISPSAAIVGNRRSSMRKITQRTWS